jgi:transcriptional regulator with XRE-family HTH domain
MNLQNWVREIRIDQGFDQKTLAYYSGLNESQISRIESGISGLTLSALVKICYGLNISLQEVLQELEIIGHLPMLHKRDSWVYCYKITSVDLKSFWEFYWKDAQKAKGWLYASYHGIRETLAEDKSSVDYFDSANLVGQAIHGLSNRYQALPYPKRIQINDIDQIYIDNGIITIKDFSAYARRLREKCGFSQRELSRRIKLAHTAIQRLEKGQVERLLVKDLLEFERGLDAGGMLFTLGWAASEYETGIVTNKAIASGVIREKNYSKDEKYAPITWGERQKAILDAFITIERWHQLIKPDYENWFGNVRCTLQWYYMDQFMEDEPKS